MSPSCAPLSFLEGTAIRSDAGDLHKLLEAASFAAAAHAEGRRKNEGKTPYISHPLDVCRRIAAPPSSIASNPPIEVLQAALLHDTVEDTDVTLEDIEKVFGKKVRNIVEECTDPEADVKERKDLQVKMAAKRSFEAKQVKLADKLSNLCDLQKEDGRPKGWSIKRTQEYFMWAQKVTDGCADANPGLAAELNEIYRSGTFVLDGKSYKCHPEYK